MRVPRTIGCSNYEESGLIIVKDRLRLKRGLCHMNGEGLADSWGEALATLFMLGWNPICTEVSVKRGVKRYKSQSRLSKTGAAGVPKRINHITWKRPAMRLQKRGKYTEVIHPTHPSYPLLEAVSSVKSERSSSYFLPIIITAKTAPILWWLQVEMRWFWEASKR